MTNGSVKLLMMNVQSPRKPLITNPPMMHLISEIPDPAAYGANDLTSLAAEKAKSAWTV
jgi:hypothetical protein